MTFHGYRLARIVTARAAARLWNLIEGMGLTCPSAAGTYSSIAVPAADLPLVVAILAAMLKWSRLSRFPLAGRG
jgi:hypothetical protein